MKTLGLLYEFSASPDLMTSELDFTGEGVGVGRGGWLMRKRCVRMLNLAPLLTEGGRFLEAPCVSLFPLLSAKHAEGINQIWLLVLQALLVRVYQC